MTITDRNLKPTTLLKATHKGASYLAEVKAYQDEKHITLEGLEPIGIQGRTWTSLSAAACDITGNSVNGWRFWTVAAPPAGKVSAQEVIDRIDGILTTTEPLYIGDDLENTPLPPAKAPRTRQAPAVARTEETIDPDDVAGVKQPCASEDPGFGNGGTFTVDAKRTKVYNPIKPTANQRGLEPGQTRAWCDGCMSSFITEDARDTLKEPTYACPKGHRVDTMRAVQSSGTDIRSTMSQED